VDRRPTQPLRRSVLTRSIVERPVADWSSEFAMLTGLALGVSVSTVGSERRA
jgi:hypothetical protein